MASLALFLSIVFIAWQLARDSRRRTSVSAAVWIPTFMLLILGSRSLSQWLSLGGVYVSSGGDMEGSLFDQAFFLLVIVGSWIISSQRGVRWTKLLAANTTITLFYLYLAMSVLWAFDPIGSFKRWFKDFGLVAVLSVILSENDPMEAIRVIYFRCACVLFPLSVVFIKFYGDLGRAYGRAGEMMFTGVTTQKNSLGEIVMVFGLFLFWDHLETRRAGSKGLWSWIPPWDRLVLLLMGVWLLNISESKTALMCLCIGLVLMVGSRRLSSKKISRMVLIGSLSAPLLLLFVQEFASIIAPLVESLGRDLTFTGRTPIWRNILAASTVNPLFGAGFYNFWGTEGGLAIRQLMQAGVQSAHNGYLDIYLDGGLTGVVLLFCMILARGGRLISNLHGSRYQRLRFAVLIVAIIYNLSESTFARLAPIWFTTLLVLLDLPSRKPDVGNSRMAVA